MLSKVKFVCSYGSQCWMSDVYHNIKKRKGFHHSTLNRISPNFVGKSVWWKILHFFLRSTPGGRMKRWRVKSRRTHLGTTMSWKQFDDCLQFMVKIFAALISCFILKSISKTQLVRCRAPVLLQQFFEVAGFLLRVERSWVEELIEAADSGQRSLGTLAVGDYIPQNSTMVIMMITYDHQHY